MIPCAQDSDCERLCGSHEPDKRYYVCQKRYQLYDYMSTISGTSNPQFLNESTVLGAMKYAIQDPPVSMVDDNNNSMSGICTDYRYDFQYACTDHDTALVSQTVTQCADNWYVGKSGTIL